MAGKMLQLQTLIEEIQNDPAEVADALNRTATLLANAQQLIRRAAGIVTVLASAPGANLLGLTDSLTATNNSLKAAVATVEQLKNGQTTDGAIAGTISVTTGRNPV